MHNKDRYKYGEIYHCNDNSDRHRMERKWVEFHDCYRRSPRASNCCMAERSSLVWKEQSEEYRALEVASLVSHTS